MRWRIQLLCLDVVSSQRERQLVTNLESCCFPSCWRVYLYFCGCNKWLSGKRTKYLLGLRCFNNSCLTFLWFSFVLEVEAAVDAIVVSNHYTGKQNTRPGLRPFNNSFLVFAADVLDDDFTLELDAGLAEWDFGAINLILGNNDVKPVYKHKQRYVPSINHTRMEKLSTLLAPGSFLHESGRSLHLRTQRIEQKWLSCNCLARILHEVRNLPVCSSASIDKI